MKTRDFSGSGTDSNVYIALLDAKGVRTADLLLDNIFKDDFEIGKEDVFTFTIEEELDDVISVELWRDAASEKDKWFCEYIHVKDRGRDDKPVFPFPCHKWIDGSKVYELVVFNYSLPQLDVSPSHQQARKDELLVARLHYAYGEKTELPRRVRDRFLIG